MNKLYIGLGTLIITVLLTALIAPHFIDWTRYRQVFEQQASGALGMPVRVLGRAEARILPTPTFHFTDVRIGEGEGSAAIERFSAVIELAPLLRREVNIIQMRFVRPSGTVDLPALSRLASGELFERFGSVKVSLSDVRIENGAITFVSPGGGRRFQGEKLNASVDLGNASKALRMHGGVVVEGEPVMFRLAAGGGTSGARPLNLTFEPASTDLTIKADGVLLADRDGQIGYEGRFGLVHGEGDGTEGALSRKVEGQFSLTRSGIALPVLKASLGDGIRSATFQGSADVAFGDRPRFQARLASRQIDLDRLLGGGPDKPVHLADIGEAVKSTIPWLSIPQMSGNLRVEAEDIVASGSVVRDVAVNVRRIPSGWMIDRLTAQLPGQTVARLSGFVNLGEEAAFDGKAEIRSERPAALIAWINGQGGAAVPRETLDVASTLHIGPDSVSFDDLSLAFGESRATGQVAARRYDQSGERELTVSLASEHLDIDEVRRLGVALGIDGGQADRLSFSLEASEITVAGQRAGGVGVELFAEGDSLSIRRLEVRDLAGASLDARATLTRAGGRPAGQLNAVLEAQRLRPAVDFLAALAPQAPGLERLRDNAAALSPMRGEIGLDAPEGLDGDLEMTIDGRLAGTRINGVVRTVGSLHDPASVSGNVDLLVAAQDSGAFLDQFGWDGRALRNAGPARLRVNMEGEVAKGADVALEGELAGLFFDFNGAVSESEAGLQLAGETALTSSDVGPALRLAGLEMPLQAWNSGARMKGDVVVGGSGGSLTLSSAFLGDRRMSGRLSIDRERPTEISGRLELSQADLPFLLAPAAGRPVDPSSSAPVSFTGGIRGVRADIALDVGNLSFGDTGKLARNARFRYQVEPGRVRMTDLEADFAGGRMTGNLEAASERGLVALNASGRLKAASLGDLAWRDNGRPLVRGVMDLNLDLKANGRSVSALVSTLAGSGTVTVRNGTVLRLNPLAFRSVIRAADAGMELQEERVRDVFSGHLDSGTLNFTEASAGFTVNSGVVRVGSLTIDSPSAAAFGSAVADLNAGELESDWTLGVDVGGSQLAGSRPEVGLVFSGPIAAPARTVDVSPLLGFLTVRSFEREVERIERLQADILERQRLDRLLVVQRQRARAAGERMQTSLRRQPVESTLATSGASDDEPGRVETAGVDPSAEDWNLLDDGTEEAQAEETAPLPEAAPARPRRAAVRTPAPETTARPARSTRQNAQRPQSTSQRSGRPLDIRGPTAPAQTEAPKRRFRLRLPSFLRRD